MQAHYRATTRRLATSLGTCKKNQMMFYDSSDESFDDDPHLGLLRWFLGMGETSSDESSDFESMISACNTLDLVVVSGPSVRSVITFTKPESKKRSRSAYETSLLLEPERATKRLKDLFGGAVTPTKCVRVLYPISCLQDRARILEVSTFSE
jgi:hypothetical protein